MVTGLFQLHLVTGVGFSSQKALWESRLAFDTFKHNLLSVFVQKINLRMLHLLISKNYYQQFYSRLGVMIKSRCQFASATVMELLIELIPTLFRNFFRLVGPVWHEVNVSVKSAVPADLEKTGGLLEQPTVPRSGSNPSKWVGKVWRWVRPVPKLC